MWAVLFCATMGRMPDVLVNPPRIVCLFHPSYLHKRLLVHGCTPAGRGPTANQVAMRHDAWAFLPGGLLVHATSAWQYEYASWLLGITPARISG